ncbi:MAG: hypothetical protein ACXQTS_01845, partial [Candidatus Methanospirareceae archaeon]
ISVYLDPIKRLRLIPRIWNDTYEVDLSGYHGLYDPSNPTSMKSLCLGFFRLWFRQQYYFITPEPDAQPGEEGILRVTIEDLKRGEVISVISARLVVAEPITPDDLSQVETHSDEDPYYREYRSTIGTLMRTGYDELGRSIFQLAISSSTSVLNMMFGQSYSRTSERLIIEFHAFDNLVTFPAEVTNAHGSYQDSGWGYKEEWSYDVVCVERAPNGTCLEWKRVPECLYRTEAGSYSKSGFMDSPEQIMKLFYTVPVEISVEEGDVIREVLIKVKGEYPARVSEWHRECKREGAECDLPLICEEESRKYESSVKPGYQFRMPISRYAPSEEEEAYHLFMHVSPNFLKAGAINVSKVGVSLLKTVPGELLPVPVPGVRVRFRLEPPLGKLIPRYSPEELEKILSGELEPEVVEEAVTNSDGEIFLLYLPPNQTEFTKLISSNKLNKLIIDIVAEAEVEGRSLQTFETVTIAKGPTLEGKVLDVVLTPVEGEVGFHIEYPPLEGVDITVVSPTGRAYFTKTDAEGYFGVVLDDEEEPGIFKFYLSKEDFAPPKPIEVEVEEFDSTTYEFKFPYWIARGNFEGLPKNTELIREIHRKIEELVPDLKLRSEYWLEVEDIINHIENYYRELFLRAEAKSPVYIDVEENIVTWVYDEDWNDWNILMRLIAMNIMLLDILERAKDLVPLYVEKTDECLKECIKYLKELEALHEQLEGMSEEELIERLDFKNVSPDRIKSFKEETLKEIESEMEDIIKALYDYDNLLLDLDWIPWKEVSEAERKVSLFLNLYLSVWIEDLLRMAIESGEVEEVENVSKLIVETCFFNRFAIPIIAFYMTFFIDGFGESVLTVSKPNILPSFPSLYLISTIVLATAPSVMDSEYKFINDSDPVTAKVFLPYISRLATATYTHWLIIPFELTELRFFYLDEECLEGYNKYGFLLIDPAPPNRYPLVSPIRVGVPINSTSENKVRCQEFKQGEENLTSKFDIYISKLEELKESINRDDLKNALICFDEILRLGKELRGRMKEMSLKATSGEKVVLTSSFEPFITITPKIYLFFLKWLLGEVSAEEFSDLLEKAISSFTSSKEVLGEFETELMGRKLPPMAKIKVEKVTYVRSGESFTIKIELENRGEENGNFWIRASEEGPIVLLTPEIEVGEIAPGEKKEVELELEAINVLKGVPQEAKLSILASPIEGISDFETLIITVLPPMPLVLVSTDRHKYTGGETMLLNLTLLNPTDRWRQVKFLWRLDLPDYSFSFPIINNISLWLPPGYDKTFTLRWKLPIWKLSFNASWYVAIYDAKTSEMIYDDVTDWKYVTSAS